MHLSPRQAEILRLIASGRSDKEIASQLGMSLRTVRTHLERLYLQTRLNSRAALVSLWHRDQHESRVTRPADECPYARPFPEDFDECPAFQPRQFVSLDLSDRPLSPITTCRHLTTRSLPSWEGRWYGACEVGDVVARAEWARGVGADRLNKIAELQEDMSRLTGAFVQELWARKSLQLRDLKAGRDASAASQAMRDMAEEFIKQAEAFLEERRAVLEEVGMPLDAVLELIRVSIDRFVSTTAPWASLNVPESILSRFSPEARSFLVPARALSATRR